MFKRLLALALAVGVIVIVGAIYAASPPPAETVSFHGPDLLSTNAKEAVVGAAIQKFHDKLCKYVPDAKGQLWDPTYSIDSRNWRSPAHGEFFTTSVHKFSDQQANTIELQLIKEGGRQTFIVVRYEGDPLLITNQLLLALKAEGVPLADE